MRGGVCEVTGSLLIGHYGVITWCAIEKVANSVVVQYSYTDKKQALYRRFLVITSFLIMSNF